MKILTEDDKEVSIQELSNDEIDTQSLTHEVEEELKDVNLDFDDDASASEDETPTSEEFLQDGLDDLFELDNDFDE